MCTRQSQFVLVFGFNIFYFSGFHSCYNSTQLYVPTRRKEERKEKMNNQKLVTLWHFRRHMNFFDQRTKIYKKKEREREERSRKRHCHLIRSNYDTLRASSHFLLWVWHRLIWLVGTFLHGVCVEKVPDQDGVIMRATYYLEVVKLEPENSTRVFLLQSQHQNTNIEINFNMCIYMYTPTTSIFTPTKY